MPVPPRGNTASEGMSPQGTERSVLEDLEQLLLNVIDLQKARVFQALENEKRMGVGLDKAASVELRRLKGYISEYREMRRSRDAESHVTPMHGTGILNSIFASVFDGDPRCRKRSEIQ
jgi:hypothetical protein